jgi:hypothetical protein
MDPGQIVLSRRHSSVMGALFTRFLDAYPDVESEVDRAQMTATQGAAWAAYRAGLLADSGLSDLHLPPRSKATSDGAATRDRDVHPTEARK